jgi:hypothetical protein
MNLLDVPGEIAHQAVGLLGADRLDQSDKQGEEGTESGN